MITPDDLMVIAPTLAPPNDEIVGRAAFYLVIGGRYGLETAHNLVTDACMNLALSSQPLPTALTAAEEDLYLARIEQYGSLGRQPDMTPPYWRP